MLAAIPSDDDRTLATVELALRLAERNEAIPGNLKFYLDEVLNQAVSIERDPSAATGLLFPEAIQLALRIREVGPLRSAIERATREQPVSSELASSILSGLERQLAPAK